MALSPSPAKNIYVDENGNPKPGMEALAEAINLIYHDNVKLLPNDHRRKSYYSFPSRKDVLEFKKNRKKFY